MQLGAHLSVNPGGRGDKCAQVYTYTKRQNGLKKTNAAIEELNVCVSIRQRPRPRAPSRLPFAPATVIASIKAQAAVMGIHVHWT